MSSAGSLPRPRSSNAHIPKLSYRSSSASLTPSLPKSEAFSDISTIQNNDTIVPSNNATSQFPVRQPATRQFTYSSKPSSRAPSTNSDSQQSQGRQSGRSSRSITPAAKKKSGLLTSLFTTQEPSMVALAKMEAQMNQKKHSNSGGRVNPVGMPGVSSAKLPPTVPKVNTKWDGIPDAMKQRDKETERERRWSRSSKSESSSARSHSSGPIKRQLEFVRPTSSATFDSFGSHSLYAASENYSIDSLGVQVKGRDRKVSSRPSPLKSSPGASLPDVSSLLPSDMPPPPAIPEEFRNESKSTFPRNHPLDVEPPIEIPDHTTSPLPTPTDSTPPTPSPPMTPMPSKGPEGFHFPWDDGPPPPIPPRNAARSPVPDPTPVAHLHAPRSHPLPKARSSNSFREHLRDESLLSPIIEIRSDNDDTSLFSQASETDIIQRSESSRQRLGLFATVRKDVEPPPWDDPTSLQEERPKPRFSFLSRGKAESK